jgi:hypothetical protein
VAALPAIMLMGSAISAMGAIGQANAQQAAHEYNATLRERDAVVSTNQANVEAERVRRASLQAEGSLLAGAGASGVTLEGSPLDVLAMSASNAKLDEETVLYNGRLKAMGYTSDATLERQAGKVAKQQGYINAASYLVGGAGQAAYSAARINTGSGGSATALQDSIAAQKRGYS